MSRDSENVGGEGGHETAALGEAILSRLQAFRARGPDEGRSWFSALASSGSLTSLVLLAFLSALSGTAILYILNSEAQSLQDKSYSVALALLFVAVIVVQRYTERVAVTRAAAAIERALHAWRIRISGKVVSLSLRDLESLSRGRVQDGLARYYEQLSQTVVPLVSGFESLILLAFMLVYLFFLSPTAALLASGVAVVLAAGYLNTARSLKPLMTTGAQADAQLSRLSEGMVAGFKELRLDDRKRAALREDIFVASEKVTVLRIKAAELISELISAGRSASYLLAAAIVFILPLFSDTGEGDVSRIVTAVLFLLGPIGSVINASQQFATAQFCIDSITAFERQLDDVLPVGRDLPLVGVGFSSIALARVHYAHPGHDSDTAFALRGLDFRLERGQIVFLTGANGSGKTTALRVLSGLYPIDGGRIELNGTALPVAVPQDYRSLFSVVFADCHIFPKPYGLDEAQMETLEDMLRYMGIRDKLPDNLSDGYDPESLSTGQRKRLALCLAVAEGRPILVLDEWAADQDPETRARFYNEILPMLKARGKTVVAITHDDRYFGAADARYHMEEGRMHQVDSA